ncbi:MAG: hypothetical protein ACI8XB_001828 [Patiriisocius sp.]|jgi:hypothetical protein
MNKYLLLFAIVFTIDISAQQIITDRPDQTESSSTINKGSLQIEAGVLVEYFEKFGVNFRNVLAPTNLFRLGITEGVELRILNQVEYLKSDKETLNLVGVSDLEIGTKVQVLRNEDVNTEIAVLSHLIVPTGGPSFTIDSYGTINKISIAHEISDDIGLGYNIGYDYFGFGDGNLTNSIAVGVGLTEKLGLYIEQFGSFIEFEDYENNFDGGITYLLRDNLQLDYSFGVGLTSKSNYVSLGFSWNIDKK